MARQRRLAEPYKIKMIEPIKMTTRTERETELQKAGFNTFLLESPRVRPTIRDFSMSGASSENPIKSRPPFF